MGFHMPVFVGPQRAGKTTIGEKIAETLNTNFVDSDSLLCKSLGFSDIKTLVLRLGEEEFRYRENSLAANIFGSCQDSVISMGGGFPYPSSSNLGREFVREMCDRNLLLAKRFGDFFSFFYLIYSDDLVESAKFYASNVGVCGNENDRINSVGTTPEEIYDMLRIRDEYYREISNKIIYTKDRFRVRNGEYSPNQSILEEIVYSLFKP